MKLSSDVDKKLFNWDGSDVTDIISHSDIYEAVYEKIKYWVIKYKEITEICMVKTTKTNIPCLIDELKSLFNLPKIGTQWCRQGGKLRILFKCEKTSEGYIKETINLSQVTHCSPMLKLQVQEIFAFRELLGVTCSYTSSIHIRQGKNGIYPISFYEPNMLTMEKTVVPETVISKWFEQTSIDDVVKRLCKIQHLDTLPILLHTLRTKIDVIIDRVDRRAISYKSCIINRITERLQTTLV